MAETGALVPYGYSQASVHIPNGHDYFALASDPEDFPYPLESCDVIGDDTKRVRFYALNTHGDEDKDEKREADSVGHAFALVDSFDRGEDYDETVRKRDAEQYVEAAFSALVAIEDAAARIRTERTSNAMMESAYDMRAALAQIVLDDFGEDLAGRLDERHEAGVNDMGADLAVDTISEAGDGTE